MLGRKKAKNKKNAGIFPGKTIQANMLVNETLTEMEVKDKRWKRWTKKTKRKLQTKKTKIFFLDAGMTQLFFDGHAAIRE